MCSLLAHMCGIDLHFCAGSHSIACSCLLLLTRTHARTFCVHARPFAAANLLVGMRDKTPVCKVADFGLSKQKQQTFVSGWWPNSCSEQPLASIQVHAAASEC